MKYETWWSQSGTLNDDRIAESSRVEISSLQPLGKIWRNHPQNPSRKHKKHKQITVHQLIYPRKQTWIPKMMGWKRELPLKPWQFLVPFGVIVGFSRRPADPSSLARGNGICLNALICRSLRPAVKRFRSWSVGGFFTEDGGWEWRCWNIGFCHPTNEDLKRALELFESFWFVFLRLIRDDCILGAPSLESKESLWGCQNYHQGFEDLRPVLEDELSKDLP